jgi:hypothetical protein
MHVFKNLPVNVSHLNEAIVDVLMSRGANVHQERRDD